MAFFASCMYFVLLLGRSWEHLEKARFYERAAGIAAVRASNVASGAALLGGYSDEQKRAMVGGSRRLVAHADRMRAKYRRAAMLPWLPVAADPPTPE